jgi:tetratricopeptide (TPR) repeat protein
MLAFAIYKTTNKTRAIAFGGLFFLLSIVFMLQIFGAGAGFMADRYIKVPYLGLVFIVGWALQQNQEKWKKATTLIWIIFAVFNLFLMTLTYNRCKIWKDGGTLWGDVILKYPGKEARPYTCRAVYYRSKGETDKTLADLNTTLAIDNRDAEMTLLRGNIFFEKGKDDSAYSDYMRVLKLKTDNSLAYGNLGAIYVRRNQLDSAVTALTRSLELDSSFAASYANRAVAYGGMGKTLESIEDFKRYLDYKPDDEKVFTSIALAYNSLGRYADCMEWLDKAIKMKPDFGNYYLFRSETLVKTGNKKQALADALKARALGTEISPDYIKSLQ